MALDVLVLVTPSARADILFLDMNAGEQEVFAVENFAKAHHENLITIPHLPAETRKRLAQLRVITDSGGSAVSAAEIGIAHLAEKYKSQNSVSPGLPRPYFPKLARSLRL